MAEREAGSPTFISARAQCAAWVRRILNDEPEVRLSDLRLRAMSELGNDPYFVDSLKEEFFAQALHLCINETVARTRKRNNIPSRQPYVPPAQRIVNRRRRLVWEKWMEYTGTRHMRVMEMSKQDLLAAVRIRSERGEHELAMARFWEALAERMPADTVVRDVFTEEEITNLWHDVVGDDTVAVPLTAELDDTSATA